MSVGDTESVSRLLTELVLSQFLFTTKTSFERWLKLHYTTKAKYGQGYEANFENDDGSLNYQKMLITIEKLVSEDKKLKPVERKHPSHEQKYLIKEAIENETIKM